MCPQVHEGTDVQHVHAEPAKPAAEASGKLAEKAALDAKAEEDKRQRLRQVCAQGCQLCVWCHWHTHTAPGVRRVCDKGRRSRWEAGLAAQGPRHWLSVCLCLSGVADALACTLAGW